MKMVADFEAYEFGAFALHPGQGRLLRDGEPVKLGSRALQILVALVRQAGSIVVTRELIEAVWPDTYVDDSNLRVHLSALRRALGETSGAPNYIQNVPGRGYRFIAPMSQQPVRSPAPAAPTTSNSGLIGRCKLIRQVADALGQHRMVTLVGPGGVGKTSIAREAAPVWCEAEGFAAVVVDLAAVPDGGCVRKALAVALGLEGDFEAATARLLQADTLLVFDSCEHLLGAVAELCERLLAEVPRLRILNTSRVPLRARGEWICRVQPLRTPAADAEISVEAMRQFPAVRLFLERAAASSGPVDLSEANLLAVAELCRKLDGLPLAIELAAGRLGMFGPSELSARIDGQLSLLSRGRRTAVERHRTLEAALDWSYRLLTPGEQTVLQRLARFSGDFSFEAAMAVTGDVGEATDAIGELLDQSLLMAEPGGGRYRLLGTTRLYLRAKAEAALLESSAA